MKMTGKYHDKEVADLLNATADAINVTAEFDAITLAQARNRYTSPCADMPLSRQRRKT
jgi:hypothetical protein